MNVRTSIAVINEKLCVDELKKLIQNNRLSSVSKVEINKHNCYFEAIDRTTQLASPFFSINFPIQLLNLFYQRLT